MVTIVDVARHAGVSTATVSYVLSGKRNVAPESQLRVLAAIEALQFRPNALASGLRSQRTRTVSLIIPDITNPYYPMLARGIQDALAAEKYHVFLGSTDAQLDLEREFISDGVALRVAGMILVTFGAMVEDVQGALAAHIPLVSLGGRIDHPDIDIVATDDCQGAFTAVNYLLGCGHRRIGFIGNINERPLEARFAGYCQALQDAGLSVDARYCIPGDFTRSDGERAITKLLDLSSPPSAVFCANDLMAIGVLHTAHLRGLRVPDELAIVGYDDIDAASLVIPPLTTVVNPAYDMGRQAGMLLLERITESCEGPRRKVVVPYRFVQRQSA